MIRKTVKQKTCKVCKEKFTPFMSTAVVCSTMCAIKFAESKRVKEFRKETKILKDKIKTKAQWAKEAQAAVNAYIRARDSGKPCVSCGKPDNGQHQRHASHFRSVGACSSLRFNTWNIHASCMQCNSILSGNLIEYRIRLKGKVGVDRVEWLESQNDITRYSIDYLKRIKKIFTKRAKRLQ